MDVRVGLWRKLSTEELMLLNCGVGEDSWESLRLQGDPISSSWRRSVLDVHWKDWCCSWNSNTLATSCEGLTHWKRPWCWEGLGAGREGDDGGWDGWMVTPTRWAWIWVDSRSWWWTGKPGVLRFMRWQRVRHNWAIELNWMSIWASQEVLVVKNLSPNAGIRRDMGSIYLCIRKIPWSRKWQPAPVFLPGKFHGQKSLAGYHPLGCKESRHDWMTEHLQRVSI